MVSTNCWQLNALGKKCPPVANGGRWSKAEIDQLFDVIQECCASEQIELESLINTDHKVRGLWVDVAKRFINRPVNSVYRKGLRVIQRENLTTGPWSEEESSKLLDLVLLHGKKWAKISKKIGRSTEACADKYRIVNKTYISGRWTDAETERLKTIVAEYSTEEVMPWTVISERMGDRTRISCFKKWSSLCISDNMASGVEGGQESHQSKKTSEESQPQHHNMIVDKSESRNKGKIHRSKKTTKQSQPQPQNSIVGSPQSENKNENREIEQDTSITIKSVYEVMKKILKETPEQSMKQKTLRRAVKARYPAKKGKQLKKIIKSAMNNKTNFILDGNIVTIQKTGPSSTQSSGSSIDRKKVKKAMKKILRKTPKNCMNLEKLRFDLMIKTSASSEQEMETIVSDIAKRSPFGMENNVVMLCEV